MISLMNLTVDMIIEGLSYMIWNSDVDCAGICVRIILLIVYLSESFLVWRWCVFRLWRDSHKLTQGWKVSFWGSVRGKFSVNNKMIDLGNILQNTFYACCYILLSGTRPERRCAPICGAAMLLRCNWSRNLAAVNCILHWIVLTLSTLHTHNHRRGRRRPPRTWKISGQPQVPQKSWIIKYISVQRKIPGQLCFSGQAQVTQKFWM